MAVNGDKYREVIGLLGEKVKLIAVSKIKPPEDIKAMYDLGQRDFGENYVQELVDKQKILPPDIRWHFIGHLQSNKIKSLISFVHLIQGVDSVKLIKEINRQAAGQGIIIACLLQVHIAQEETKFGFDVNELDSFFFGADSTLGGLKNIKILGLMGMASLTEDLNKIRTEYRNLKSIYDKYAGKTASNCHFSILSMGMSSDFEIAIEEGSSMIRIGSLLFGKRVYPNK
jgi:pyridoxal phosphate enzyme (YggS family)